MMKTKRLLGALAAVVMTLSAFAFSACGGKKPADSSDDPLAGVEISVGIANNASEKAILNTFRTAYLKKYPARKIKTDLFTGEFDNILGMRVGSKSVPDVVQVYDFSAEYWTSKGVFAPLNDYFAANDINESDYFETIVDMTKSGTDGKIYWAARDYNKIVVAINKEMFKVAGVDIPSDDWTWDEFIATCKALNAKSDLIRRTFGQEIFYPVDANLNWEAVYYPAIKSFGGDLFDSENNTALKNLDGIKEGLGKYISAVDEKLASNPSDENTSAFGARQAAMNFIVRPNVTSLANVLKDSNGVSQLDFVTMPAFTGANVEKSYIGVGCTGYALSSSSTGKKAEAAWEFIKYIISEEGQEVFAKSGAGIPVLKKLAIDENAPFRSFLPGANHDAFVSHQERDLSMNYLHGVKVNKHLDVRRVLKQELMKNLVSSSDRNAFYQSLKIKLENAM